MWTTTAHTHQNEDNKIWPPAAPKDQHEVTKMQPPRPPDTSMNNKIGKSRKSLKHKFASGTCYNHQNQKPKA
eukprot:10824915-Karenia_brevis.AAC.1